MIKPGTLLIIAMICSAVLMAGCGGKSHQAGNPENGSTSAQAAAETEPTDLDEDTAGEETEPEHETEPRDLLIDGSDRYTQFFHLSVPGEWEANVNYHYFQDPDQDRYALDIVEYNSMIASEGTGGLVYSIVLYEKYEEERGMESSRYLGMLRNEEGRFLYVFLEYPKNAGDSGSTEGTRRMILDFEDQIPDHLEGRNGFEFSTGKSTVDTETEE